MKLPKKTNRYCRHCNKHTEHKIENVGSGHKRSTLKRGGKSRIRKRGKWRGVGNKGKYSRTTTPKMKSKQTKKTNLLYTCQVCKKSSYQKRGKRAGKIQIEEPQKK